MSRERGIADATRAAYRKGACRWCDKPVEPPRRTFCGDGCVHEWKLRSHPAYRRQKVFERDGGICATCGRDCHVLGRDLLRMLYARSSDLELTLAKLGLMRRAPEVAPMRTVGGAPGTPRLRVWEPGRSLWEVDHIVAVVEGGGSCDLSNLQTLCWACHATKTAALARRRAELRANVQPPEELFGGPDVAPPWDLFDD